MDFPTTHWSVLAVATVHGESDARAALETLCQRYWGPVHSFLRFRGLTDAEAKDLTQEFMIHVVQKSIFTRADRLQGKFRSFLLGSLTRFLSDAADRKNALKRGGALPHVSFDTDVPGKDLEDLSSPAPGGSTFDREWALTILETALEKLRAECLETGNQSCFEIWKHFLPGANETFSYETAAGKLGISVAALKSEVHRLRRRLRALVRTEVARTVSAPHEIESEMAHLQQVLMDRGSELGSKKNETSGF
ncbi:MAG TPA: sigma-70 family RNA polymerase sigma factor [Verrucomicrobiae bacterium]|nr:sigma-70 family RNA polymerase sigma factor [Verrucomicrobiae bacterium]